MIVERFWFALRKYAVIRRMRRGSNTPVFQVGEGAPLFLLRRSRAPIYFWCDCLLLPKAMCKPTQICLKNSLWNASWCSHRGKLFVWICQISLSFAIKLDHCCYVLQDCAIETAQRQTLAFCVLYAFGCCNHNTTASSIWSFVVAL